MPVTTSATFGSSTIMFQPSGGAWAVLEYEVAMYLEMRRLSADPATLLLSDPIRNALAESHVLHARILCDLFSKEKREKDDDIDFQDLFDSWDTSPRYKSLKALIQQMGTAYGSGKGSPRWQFNKMLAHSTKNRSTKYDYGSALLAVDARIRGILRELVRLNPNALL